MKVKELMPAEPEKVSSESEMDYERIRDFIISFSKDDEGILGELHDLAMRDEVPIIRTESRDFIKMLLRIVRPGRILEIGTAVGYSALVMASVMGSMRDDVHIDTCEMDSDRIAVAKDFISRAGMDDKITIYEGDAEVSLEGLSGNSYDFVFIDAAKAQYRNYLDKVMEMVHEGSVIVSDNILADGDVLESHFLVQKRDRTIHDRMRDYLYYIKNNERLETAILSVADGMAVSVVK